MDVARRNWRQTWLTVITVVRTVVVTTRPVTMRLVALRCTECTPGGMVIVSLCPGQNEREESRKPGQGVSVVVETVHARGIGKNVVVVSLLSGQQLNCTPAVRAPRVSQDVIQQLYDQYDASPAKFRFYVPQLCNFLVHGRAERPLPYDVFILDKCEK